MIKHLGKNVMIDSVKNVFLHTYGCSLNQTDSETMAGLLSKDGYRLVEHPKEADAVVINSCTVKHSAESKLFSYIQKIKRLKKPIVVAGCVPQAQKSLLDNQLKNISVVGVHNLNDICHVIGETILGNTVHMLSHEKNERLNLPKIRRNPVIEIVPINAGCLSNCTFCKTKQARGGLVSYDKRAILRQVRNAAKEGVKEVWLTSQDTGAYGKDMGESITSLLHAITKVEGDFKVRLGMCSPNFAFEYLDEFIKLFHKDKLFKFLHIPVQAGNDKVLKQMGRRYNLRQYKTIIREVKDVIPDLTIATDIICGFPTETEEQFRGTLRLIKTTAPDIVNFSRFWPRPGTKAALFQELPPEITKERIRKVQEVHNQTALGNNRKWLDWEGEIVITEKGKDNTLVGKNYAYKQVVLRGKKKLGQKAKVKVQSFTAHDLRAF
jgi:threonylcarbamoyladenosine tRNA methylthiotransferase CDKAL1